MARRSMGVGATTADVSERAAGPLDRRVARPGTEARCRIEERITQVSRGPRFESDAATDASLLDARFSDARAVVSAGGETVRLGDAGSRVGAALAGRAAASHRASAESRIGALTNVTAGAAALGIGGGVGARSATAATSGAATAATGRPSRSCGARASGPGSARSPCPRGVCASGAAFARAACPSASGGAAHSCRASGATETHARVRRAGEAGVARRVTEARASFGALRAACWAGAAACGGSQRGRNSNRQEPGAGPLHSVPRITF